MERPHTHKMRKQQMIRTTMRRRVDVVVMVVLLIISLAHLCRLVTGVDLVIGRTVVPMWVSLFGCIGPALLAGLVWWTRP